MALLADFETQWALDGHNTLNIHDHIYHDEEESSHEDELIMLQDVIPSDPNRAYRWPLRLTSNTIHYNWTARSCFVNIRRFNSSYPYYIASSYYTYNVRAKPANTPDEQNFARPIWLQHKYPQTATITFPDTHILVKVIDDTPPHSGFDGLRMYCPELKYYHISASYSQNSQANFAETFPRYDTNDDGTVYSGAPVTLQHPSTHQHYAYFTPGRSNNDNTTDSIWWWLILAKTDIDHLDIPISPFIPQDPIDGESDPDIADGNDRNLNQRLSEIEIQLAELAGGTPGGGRGPRGFSGKRKLKKLPFGRY